MSDPASMELISGRGTKRKWNFTIFEDPSTEPSSPTSLEESDDDRYAPQPLNASNVNLDPTSDLPHGRIPFTHPQDLHHLILQTSLTQLLLKQVHLINLRPNQIHPTQNHRTQIHRVRLHRIQTHLIKTHNMPYNNTAIPPSDEVTGTAALPLARVKKILQADEEIGPVSNNAAFVITLATEMFVRYLAEQAHNVAKSESKPRRSIQYRDVANAVARLDNLEFLSDVIPRTTTWREHKEKKAKESGGETSARRSRPLAAGQTTLDDTNPHSGQDQVMAEGITEVDEDGTLSPEEHTSRPATAQSASGSGAANGNPGLVFEHYAPNGDSKPEESDDVEMT
ncbi:hypothetical protein MMC18_003524 [Xylographa bjoerkii]|nr:hypothetical protein [Xylographa bjoerkii]